MIEAASRLLSRRTLLRLSIVSALAAITGCRGGSPSSTSSIGASSRTANKSATSALTEDPAVRAVVQHVANAERTLMAAYDEMSVIRPELATLLAPLRADHATHLNGLLGSAAGSPAGEPSSPPSPASSPPSAINALAHLAALERAAANARLSDMPAASPALSRLIASIGACEASHGAVLDVARSRTTTTPTPDAKGSGT